jgi:SET domain-containing protein
MYKPLPNSLTIKQSGINGLGLFANEEIAEGTNLGMSHLELGKLIIRTPLGGFVNHSNTPNCIKVYLLLTRQEWNHLSDLPNAKYNLDFKIWNLAVIKDIKKGEELTVRYTFYKM